MRKNNAQTNKSHPSHPSHPVNPCNAASNGKKSKARPVAANPDPQELPSPASEGRQRNGHVARLSKALRDQINHMLLDGAPFKKIIKDLGLHAFRIKPAHIGTWKAGGYLAWLKEQRLLEECRLRQELTLDFAREEPGIDGFAAAHKIAIGLISQAAAEFGPEALRQGFKANPLNFLRALNCLPRLTNGGLRCHQRLSDEQERKADLVKKQQPQSKKGLSPEVRDEMIESLNLM